MHWAASRIHESGIDYDGHRARAFALAVDGRTGEALEELSTGWTGDWPTPDAYGVDVARIHIVAGNPGQALTALAIDLRTIERSQIDNVLTLVALCVRCDRRLWRKALPLALANARGLTRLLVPLRIGEAWLRGADGTGLVPDRVSPAP